jgi:glutathione S-transferase
MAKLKIYGVPISRSIRTIWTALELGIDYEIVPIGWDDNSIYSEDYRRINPNARVPTIDDDGFVLWESLAITLYLVRKHGGAIAPADLREEALAWQWTLWAAAQLEAPLIRWAMHGFILDPEERDAGVAEAAMAQVRPLLDVLDTTLAQRAFLAAERFTVADLNVGAVLLRPRHGLDLAPWPNLQRWDRAVFERPAARRAWEIRVAATGG